MGKYIKRSVVIEAVQYVKYGELVKGMCNSQHCSVHVNNEPHVHTIHNDQIVNLEVGDWIIPEPDGVHFYPCKPDIFENTYLDCIEEYGEIDFAGELDVNEKRIKKYICIECGEDAPCKLQVHFHENEIGDPPSNCAYYEIAKWEEEKDEDNK